MDPEIAMTLREQSILIRELQFKLHMANQKILSLESQLKEQTTRRKTRRRSSWDQYERGIYDPWKKPEGDSLIVPMEQYNAAHDGNHDEYQTRTDMSDEKKLKDDVLFNFPLSGPFHLQSLVAQRQVTMDALPELLGISDISEVITIDDDEPQPNLIEFGL